MRVCCIALVWLWHFVTKDEIKENILWNNFYNNIENKLSYQEITFCFSNVCHACIMFTQDFL